MMAFAKIAEIILLRIRHKTPFHPKCSCHSRLGMGFPFMEDCSSSKHGNANTQAILLVNLKKNHL